MEQRELTSRDDRPGSWMLPAAKGTGLIYATSGCSGTCVFSYPSGTLVGSLTAGNPYGPNGDCADTKGDVFISNNDTVLEYPHGETTPIAAFGLPGTDAQGCTVDPTTGNLAVVFRGTGANVAVFPSASETPTTYNTQMTSWYCGYDDKGNLFVDGNSSGNAGAIVELPVGENQFRGISVPGLSAYPGQIQWDGKYITWESVKKGSPTGSRLKISGSGGSIVSTTDFAIKKNAGQSWISGSAIFIPYSNFGEVGHQARVGIWQYPRGGKPTISIKLPRSYRDSLNFQGVTFSPR